MTEKHWNDSFLVPSHNPEPSKYHPELEIEGKLKVSNYSTPKMTIFSKRERFELEKSTKSHNSDSKRSLGPGAYEIKDDFSSRKKHPASNCFGIAARNTYVVDSIKKSFSPGPKYILP